MKKSHDRSPDKRAFSVALPKALIKELGEIADQECRSRNGQIELFLSLAVKEWKDKDKGATQLPTAGGAPHGSRFLGGPRLKGA